MDVHRRCTNQCQRHRGEERGMAATCPRLANDLTAGPACCVMNIVTCSNYRHVAFTLFFLLLFSFGAVLKFTHFPSLGLCFRSKGSNKLKSLLVWSWMIRGFVSIWAFGSYYHCTNSTHALNSAKSDNYCCWQPFRYASCPQASYSSYCT